MKVHRIYHLFPGGENGFSSTAFELKERAERELAKFQSTDGTRFFIREEEIPFKRKQGNGEVFVVNSYLAGEDEHLSFVPVPDPDILLVSAAR